MAVNEAVVDRLVENGTRTVFGIPGRQTSPLNRRLRTTTILLLPLQIALFVVLY